MTNQEFRGDMIDAIHESGHAVAAYVLGISFSFVTLDPIDGSGTTRAFCALTSDHPVVTSAGPLADELWAAQSPGWAWNPAELANPIRPRQTIPARWSEANADVAESTYTDADMPNDTVSAMSLLSQQSVIDAIYRLSCGLLTHRTLDMLDCYKYIEFDIETHSQLQPIVTLALEGK